MPTAQKTSLAKGFGKVTIDEAAAALGVSTRTLYSRVESRRVSHYRFGHRILFDLEELRNELLERVTPEA